jgi:uncharacterized protein YdaU (DUF1376 family)
MSKFPAMPMFIDAMLADTEHLTNEEFGAYHRLLYAMWRRNGAVPDNNRDLARICRASRRRWPHIKARLMTFLEEDDQGNLTQKKLRKEWQRLVYKMTQNVTHPLRLQLNENNELDLFSRARVPDPYKKEKAGAVFNGYAASGPSPGCEGRSGPPPQTALSQRLVAKGLKRGHH